MRNLDKKFCTDSEKSSAKIATQQEKDTESNMYALPYKFI